MTTNTHAIDHFGHGLAAVSSADLALFVCMTDRKHEVASLCTGAYQDINGRGAFGDRERDSASGPSKSSWLSTEVPRTTPVRQCSPGAGKVEDGVGEVERVWALRHHPAQYRPKSRAGVSNTKRKEDPPPTRHTSRLR